MKERRRSLRIPVRTSIQFRILPYEISRRVSEPVKAALSDLSIGGLALQTRCISARGQRISIDQILSQENRVYLHWKLPSDSSVRVLAETRWHRRIATAEPWYVIGFQFDEFLEKGRTAVEDYVQNLLGSVSLPASREPMGPSDMHAWISGGADGNPGPGGIGVVFKSGVGHVLTAISKYVGLVTAAHAEYQAFLTALVEAKKRNVRKLVVHTDSLLIRAQMGNYGNILASHLYPFVDMARIIIKTFDCFDLVVIPRDGNRDAESLARLAIMTKE